MRADIVVVVTPSAERLAHMGEAVEDLFIEELVPQASVEAFDKGALRRSGRLACLFLAQGRNSSLPTTLRR